MPRHPTAGEGCLDGVELCLRGMSMRAMRTIRKPVQALIPIPAEEGLDGLTDRICLVTRH
jgi:hypothetical protein